MGPSEVSPSTSARMEKIRDWLIWMEDRYESLISRASETASTSGWDDSPRVRPCEHKLEWRHEGLCLVCNNTMLRSCDKNDDRAIDPYALGVSQTKGGFTARSAGDESAAQKASGSIAKITAELSRLQASSRLRDGSEAEPDAAMRKYLRIKYVPRELKLIMGFVTVMSDKWPDLARTLPDGHNALYLLSFAVSGRLSGPPV